MIKRIVIMEILPGQEALFLDIFEEVKQQIRAQPGCLSLEVLDGRHHDHVTLCTISSWANEEALEAYRSSSLFNSTWSRVKPLFAHKARAWTLHPIESIS
ncbi:MAG TPA: antibiotic biosynthesis monooxygenase family protein [Saprospiraceae bacterium]|nr:antibiotic biosynthesis monooxygenase family protein [Saprospiraceae bacterium]